MRNIFIGHRFVLTVLLLSCLSALSAQSQWTGPDGSNNIYNNNTGNVGIGTSTPRTNLEVAGYLNATTGLSVGTSGFTSNVPVNGFSLTFTGIYGIVNPGSGHGFGIELQTNHENRMVITDNSVSIPTTHVLINQSTDNGNLLQVNGNLWATGLVLPTGAAAGKVLTSDASGNATWQTAASSSAGWSMTGNSGVNPATTFLGTTDNTPLAIRAGNVERMRVNYGTGFVGIGTTTPQAVLEVSGPLLATGSGSTGSVSEMARFSANNGNLTQFRFTTNRYADGNSWTNASTRVQVWTDVTPQGYIDFNPNNGAYDVAFGSGSTEVMRVKASGNVLIGKTAVTNSSYLLDVNGNSRFNQVVVNSNGADYVFDPGYKLSSLEQLAVYVHKEHHLPGISPAAQMQQEGLNLGDNQTRLLAKIEELTLYAIQQDKETKALKDEHAEETQALKEKIEALEERIGTLEDLEKRIEKFEHPDKTAATR